MKSRYIKPSEVHYIIYIRILLGCISAALVVYGLIVTGFNSMLCGVLLLFVSNIILSFENIKLRMIFLIYNCMIFLFLIGRPFIAMIQGKAWYHIGTSQAAMAFAVVSVYVLLLSIHIGTLLLSKNDDAKLERVKAKFHQPQSAFVKNLQLVSFALFIVAFLCACIEGWERIVFMRSHTYVEYYTLYKTTQPAIVKAFIQMMLPSMFIFLATMPSKPKSTLVLACYVTITIPSLIVGMRSPTMLAILFAFTYYFIRNVYVKDDEKKWLGKKEIIIIVVSVPAAVVFLFYYMYIRNQQSIEVAQLSNPFIGFLQQQGNTFDVLAKSYDVIPNLPDVGFPGYFFGPIYDKTTQSLLVRTIFDIPQASGQTPQFLAIAHDSKAQLSYLIMGDLYFQGQGVGTSNILDAYIDYGWLGIVTLGVLMGVFFRKISTAINKNWLVGALILSTIANTYYTPRANAMEIFGQLFNVYFWAAAVICAIITRVITPQTNSVAGSYFRPLMSKYVK